MTAPVSNADQIKYWNGVGGKQWLARHDGMEPQLAPLGLAAVEAAAPKPGERVIDIGCGTGTTSLRIADMVGDRGYVLGVDVSEPLVEAARRNAVRRPNVQFLLGDASQHRLEGGFDLLFSRFGVMFFADPAAAFRHLRAALKPGGRLAFVCWRPFKENEWAFLPFMAAVPHLPPIERPSPNAPGPFALGDDQRVKTILGEAGFKDIAVKPLDRTMNPGSTVDSAASFASDTGPISRVLNDASPEQRQAAIASIRHLFEHRAAEGKSLALAAACWIVTARN